MIIEELIEKVMSLNQKQREQLSVYIDRELSRTSDALSKKNIFEESISIYEISNPDDKSIASDKKIDQFTRIWKGFLSSELSDPDQLKQDYLFEKHN
ncbi:hypothetical protein BST97_01010 [Nonlabens spongiae]|uniref:Uncharacterized protein n=1 Tax=Nonlabens spongiae TaxID=331648 RepID=A0A1W6MGH0_9FLAO|nr:hypothetical protein [Nonlabens spongiae]ARN76695.1 hypothetical protein BST97_01010 [Nonlabens spongiae]